MVKSSKSRERVNTLEKKLEEEGEPEDKLSYQAKLSYPVKFSLLKKCNKSFNQSAFFSRIIKKNSHGEGHSNGQDVQSYHF